MNAVKEGVLQLARVALVAVVPLVISGLQAGKVDWRSILVAGIIAVLMGIDKWMHEEGKGIGNGLTII